MAHTSFPNTSHSDVYPFNSANSVKLSSKAKLVECPNKSVTKNTVRLRYV